MSLSRRQFIKASGVALCAGAAPLKAHAAGQQPALPVPPLLESRRGQPLFLTLQRSHWSFTPGTRAPVWGINGRYMGPTIRVWNGRAIFSFSRAIISWYARFPTGPQKLFFSLHRSVST